MSEGVVKGTHILFVPAAPGAKTKGWTVDNAYGDGTLGFVGWFGRWRKYCFFPAEGTVFEEVCLRETADFCERETKEYKARR
jgi:hypothetical protein